MRISHWSSDVCSSDLSPSRRRVAISCASSRKRSCWVSQLSASRSSLAEKQALSRRSTRSAGFTASGEANTTLASSKFQKFATYYPITNGAGITLVSWGFPHHLRTSDRRREITILQNEEADQRRVR